VSRNIGTARTPAAPRATRGGWGPELKRAAASAERISNFRREAAAAAERGQLEIKNPFPQLGGSLRPTADSAILRAAPRRLERARTHTTQPASPSPLGKERRKLEEGDFISTGRKDDPSSLTARPSPVPATSSSAPQTNRTAFSLSTYQPASRRGRRKSLETSQFELLRHPGVGASTRTRLVQQLWPSNRPLSAGITRSAHLPWYKKVARGDLTPPFFPMSKTGPLVGQAAPEFANSLFNKKSGLYGLVAFSPKPAQPLRVWHRRAAFR